MHRPDDYLPLQDYPSALVELRDLEVDAKRDLRRVERDLKYRKSFLTRFTAGEGQTKEERDIDKALKIEDDAEYKGLLARKDELLSVLDRYEKDISYLRDQFTVLKLRAQEKIVFHKEPDDVASLNAVTNPF